LPEGRGGEDTAKGACDGFKLTTFNARTEKRVRFDLKQMVAPKTKLGRANESHFDSQSGRWSRAHEANDDIDR
jgi:hypothetical protein